MRGYYVPLVAGLVLIGSTFLPWISLGEASLRGWPSLAAMWAAGLGALAVILATLSLITRKNSRHPLLVVGLFALGVMVISWRVLPRSVSERARSESQATAIVEGGDPDPTPEALVAVGIYVGTAASIAIVLFGLTIVVKRVVRPYAVASQDDDV
jgi:hypothetical protein